MIKLGTFQTFDVFDLDNYVDNPRHDHARNQKETLKNLFDSVGKNNMYRLAEDIAKNGLMPNLRIVVVKNDKTGHYDVYDGNRRTATLKILIDPDFFDFLDPSMLVRFKKLSEKVNISSFVECYVTDKDEALAIMYRMHSGEDQGRGMKQWGSREKDRFNVLVTGTKSFTNLIDENVRKYFDNFDITIILNWTTVTRIFNAKRIREEIGLDVHDESTFTKERMQLLIDACKLINNDAKEKGVAATRLYDKVTESEARLLPWINEYRQQHAEKPSEDVQPVDHSKDSVEEPPKAPSEVQQQDIEIAPMSAPEIPKETEPEPIEHTEAKKDRENRKNEAFVHEVKYKNKTPYFFEGLNNEKLDPNSQDDHGVIELCDELYKFSNKSKHFLKDFPFAAAFLVRSLIEQSIIYYSKNNYVQGQTKPIYDRLFDNKGRLLNLSKIIELYMKNISNFIEKESIRQYFMRLFRGYEKKDNPFNWVIHRPSEFIMSPGQLEELPKGGLLTVINYFLSHSNKTNDKTS